MYYVIVLEVRYMKWVSWARIKVFSAELHSSKEERTPCPS